MEITYLGHAGFAIETQGNTLIFDPFVRPNPLASAIQVEQLKAEYLLLSHAHGDHIADAEEILTNTGAQLIANYEMVGYYMKKGFENVAYCNTGGTVKTKFGSVTLLNALHTSVFPDGTYGGNPNSFLVKTGEGAFFYSGDTALHSDMKWYQEMYKPDFAFLCLGDSFTMGIEQAVMAARWLGVSRVIGMHFDTFPPIRIDHDAAKQAFQQAQIELILPEIGKTYTIQLNG